MNKSFSWTWSSLFVYMCHHINPQTWFLWIRNHVQKLLVYMVFVSSSNGRVLDQYRVDIKLDSTFPWSNASRGHGLRKVFMPFSLLLVNAVNWASLGRYQYQNWINIQLVMILHDPVLHQYTVQLHETCSRFTQMYNNLSCTWSLVWEILVNMDCERFSWTCTRPVQYLLVDMIFVNASRRPTVRWSSLLVYMCHHHINTHLWF